jgi:hypothetical protein
MNPGTRIAEAFTTIAAELICVTILGYLLVGPQIFVPGHPLFSYTVIAITMIGLFAILRHRPPAELYYLALFVTVILALSWFRSSSIPLTLRGIARFGVIVGTVLAVGATLKHSSVQKFRFAAIPVWLVLGIAFYIVMILMDFYLFQFYPPEETGRVGEYLLDAAKLGALLGGGIGVGLELGKTLSARSSSSPQG